MNANEIYMREINSSDVTKIVWWYNQPDKSWIYCDCPSDHPDYSKVQQNIESQINTSFDDLADENRVKFYSINYKYWTIGFAIIKKKFEYFDNVPGYSIGLDIPDWKYRNKQYGTIAIRKFLYYLAKNQDIDIKEIYLETLSYNKPMQKVAEKLGFELIDQNELGTEYQNGFSKHIAEIADCLGTEVEELKKEKFNAMLYKIDLENWPNVELKEISEADEGLFDSIELNGEERDYADPGEFEYERNERTDPLAVYDNDKVIGGAVIKTDLDSNSCEISGLFIDEKYHGCGYGKQTLLAIIEYIKQNNKDYIIRLDVDTRNVSALELYWKVGFRPVSYDPKSATWNMELS